MERDIRERKAILYAIRKLILIFQDDIQFEKMNPFDGTMAYAQNKRQQVEHFLGLTLL